MRFLSMTNNHKQLVYVGVVTYRRIHLLERALLSVRAQTYPFWKCLVINDDPQDPKPGKLIEEIGDSRISLFKPIKKRGAAGSFNEVFRFDACDFSSLLEDDNWWEPDFLNVMIGALENHPEAAVAVGNERIWREMSDGTWKDTGKLIWPPGTTSLYRTSIEFACGSTKLCNSSLLVRRGDREAWTTPEDIPVDVTEHFRERAVPQPILLVHEPLVNYSETLDTNRDTRGAIWGDYQLLLIGSIFFSSGEAEREKLAAKLFKNCGRELSPRVTTLLTVGIVFKEARVVFKYATLVQLLRFGATCIVRLRSICRAYSVRRRLSEHWKWLLESEYNKRLTSK